MNEMWIMFFRAVVILALAIPAMFAVVLCVSLLAWIIAVFLPLLAGIGVSVLFGVSYWITVPIGLLIELVWINFVVAEAV